MSNIEDLMIDLSAKIEVVDACINTVLESYLAAFPQCEPTAEGLKAFHRASSLAFVAADYIAQADRILHRLDAACVEELQKTQLTIDTRTTVRIASVVHETPQRECQKMEVKVCPSK